MTILGRALKRVEMIGPHVSAATGARSPGTAERPAHSMSVPPDRPAEQVKLQIRSLTKVFGNSPESALELAKAGSPPDTILKNTGCTVAVDEVSFSVGEGETFVIMGLSGSGKSTLVRCINRLVEPTSGQVVIDGTDVTALGKSDLRECRRKKIAMVFQSFALLPHKTVAANVAYPLRIRGLNKEECRRKALEALAAVGLEGWSERYPRHLSGGMQQRVGLARALATDPDILLMDEPFSALDPLLRRDMQSELMRLQKYFRKTIVFVSHDFNEAVLLGNRIAIMHQGRLVQIGRPEEIVLSPATDHVAEFVRDIDPTRVLTTGSLAAAKRVVIDPTDDPRAVCAELEQRRSNAAFVLDEQQAPVAVIPRDLAEQAAREGAVSIDGRLVAVFQRISADAPLIDAFALLAQGGPVAVVSATGRYVGSLEAADVLARVARQNQRDDHAASQRASQPTDVKGA